ncbi:hypothetical protein UlMin_003232 [Ulmus minor]
MADTIKIERSHSPKLYRRARIGSLFSFFSKFASDSDVNSSLKTIAEPKKEDGKGHATQFSSNGKKRLVDKLLEELQAKVEKTKEETYNAINKQHKVPVKCVGKSGEDWQKKMEKMQEDMNDIEQKHEVSAKLLEGSVPLKKTQDEDMKGSDLLVKHRKKVFIRSRL